MQFPRSWALWEITRLMPDFAIGNNMYTLWHAYSNIHECERNHAYTNITSTANEENESAYAEGVAKA